MAAPAWVLTIDETRASAQLGAAVLAAGSTGVVLEPAGERDATLERLASACARRGLAVELGHEAITVAGRSVAIIDAAPAGAARARLREGQVELERRGGKAAGERVELLAAAPLLEAFERSGSLRWGLLGVIEGRDGWTASVDLAERAPNLRLDAALQRCFPGLVGRLGLSASVGAQLGAVLHMSVVLGNGASVESVRDLLAAQAEDPRSPWPKLRLRAGLGSADCVGELGLTLDLDALVSAGPLVRLVGYFDPPSLLAGDLLRRLA